MSTGVRLFAFSLVSIVLAFTSVVSADERVILDREGTWSLPDLGYGRITMAQGEGEIGNSDPLVRPERYAQPAVQYSIPPSVAEAEDYFLVLHIHAQVEFAVGTGPGKAYVYGMTNSMASAMVEFTVSGLDPETSVAWNQLGLIDGPQAGSTASRIVDVVFRNYVNDAGTRVGTNTLQFSVREAWGVDVGRLLILEDTALEITTAKPPELELTAVAGAALSSRNLSLQYELKNIGGWPVRDVSIDAVYSNQLLRLITPAVDLKVHSLNPGEIERRSLLFEILQPSYYEVILEANAAVGSGAGVRVTGSIMERSPPSAYTYLLLVAAVLLASLTPFVPFATIRRIVAGREGHPVGD